MLCQVLVWPLLQALSHTMRVDGSGGRKYLAGVTHCSPPPPSITLLPSFSPRSPSTPALFSETKAPEYWIWIQRGVLMNQALLMRFFPFPWYSRTHISFPIFPILLSWCFLIFFVSPSKFCKHFLLRNGNYFFVQVTKLYWHYFMNRNTCAVNISSTQCLINCIEILFSYTLN